MEGYLSDLHISSCEDKELLPDLVSNDNNNKYKENPFLYHVFLLLLNSKNQIRFFNLKASLTVNILLPANIKKSHS